MSEEPKYVAPQPAVSLNVLPHSGKVEQLRQEFIAESPTAVKAAAPLPKADPARGSTSEVQGAITEKVIAAIRTVFDPEIPINIYELGLIYRIEVDPQTSAVAVQMTLTAPGCPVAGTLPRDVQKKIEAIPGVSQASVELVWDPPWTKDRMSEEALLELGLL